MRRLFALLALVAAATVVTAETEVDLRLKYSASSQILPEHDYGRSVGGTPQYDHGADLRTLLRHRQGAFTFALDHTLAFAAGDGLARAARTPGDPNAVGQLVDDDTRRPLDLTWRLGRGARHQSWHRLDRAFVNVARGNWSATVGRQAISWGGGLVFAPLDLFSPFTPTAVDKDYKPGEDAVLIERLFDDGSDLQLLSVFRRTAVGDFTGRAASHGARYRRTLGAAEFELLTGRHYRDRIFGFGLRWPVGGALARTDLLLTDSDDYGSTRVSGILNIDYSFAVRDRTVYVFGEYFHNGFGVRRLPSTVLALPPALEQRLARGEVFTLMRDYLALGAQIQWHPLWTQSQTLIGNLQDGSMLLQLSMSYEPTDATRVEFGAVASLGRRGEEYGGAPLARSPDGRALTLGGAEQIYLRWVYYL